MNRIELIIILIIVLIAIRFTFSVEKFESVDLTQIQDKCFIYGDNYDACYANPSCTIGFLPNGATHCMHKFLYEDI
jgi:hypothetical protein